MLGLLIRHSLLSQHPQLQSNQEETIKQLPIDGDSIKYPTRFQNCQNHQKTKKSVICLRKCQSQEKPKET